MQNDWSPALQIVPKKIKKTTIVTKSRNANVYPIAIWHLFWIFRRVSIKKHDLFQLLTMEKYLATYLVISLKGMIFDTAVLERDAIKSLHMVKGKIANWNKIACIVPNSKVGTPTFQLRNGAAAGTVVDWDWNFISPKWAIKEDWNQVS